MYQFVKSNFLYFKIGCILIQLMFLSSCKVSNQNLPTAPQEIAKQDTSNENGNHILSKIQPDRFWASYGSLWYLYDWRFDHYEPKSGKTVGVWPVDYSTSNLTTLRTHWGYSGIFIGADQTQYNNTISAGYTLSNIMVGLTGVPDANRASYISSFGNVFAYYVDEPADQNHSMGGIRNVLNSLNFNSLFVISGYKRTDALNSCVDAADKVMFSSYIHWYELLPGVWVSWPEDDDQRPDWSDMQNRYGSKFSMTWINSTEISEFGDLFGHAQNLGLTGVWVYTLAGHQTDEFGNISAAAYAHGFLRRFSREWKNQYKCINPNGTYTFPPSSDWVYMGSSPTDNLNEQ
jgi:hypothetical protein